MHKLAKKIHICLHVANNLMYSVTLLLLAQSAAILHKLLHHKSIRTINLEFFTHFIENVEKCMMQGFSKAHICMRDADGGQPRYDVSYITSALNCFRARTCHAWKIENIGSKRFYHLKYSKVNMLT